MFIIDKFFEQDEGNIRNSSEKRTEELKDMKKASSISELKMGEENSHKIENEEIIKNSKENSEHTKDNKLLSFLRMIRILMILMRRTNRMTL